MKYSNTTLRELSKRYKNILIKCALINAALFISFSPAISDAAPLYTDNIFENASFSNLSSEYDGGVFSTGLKNGIGPDGISLTFNGASSFTNNYAKNGGALILNKTSTTSFEGPATFTGNYTTFQYGGAIFNDGSLTFKNTASFTNNYSQATAGAIYNREGTITFKDIVSFTNNGNNTNGETVSIQGGAILNSGTIYFEKLATFTKNAAQQNGNSIFNTGNMYFNGGLIHNENGSQNAVQNNTGIDNHGVIEIIGGNVEVNNNIAIGTSGISNTGTLLIGATTNTETQETTIQPVESISFKNNSASNGSGAALNVGGNAQLYANQILFDTNTINGSYGGAIFNSGDLTINGNTNTFTNNQAHSTTDDITIKKYYQYGGGAIQNRGNTNTTTLTIGTNESLNTFENNISYQHGGAIYARAVDGAGQNSEIIINGNSVFTSNTAHYNGGAIGNFAAKTNENGLTSGGKASITFNGETTFTQNTSNGLGGAIYNNDTVTFNGATIFKENTDSLGKNDIHNDGTVTFNGDVTLDGGISGNGSVIFENGISLTAELQKTTILANSVAFNGNNSINLIVANGLANNEYDFIDATSLTGEEAVTIAENSVYNLTLNENGKINVSVKSGDELAKSINSPISSQEANALSAILTSNGEGTEKGNQITSAISNAIQNGHSAEAVQAIQDLAPSTSQVVSNIAREASATISRISSTRMDSVKGTSGGDTFEGTGIWAQGLYNHTKQDATANSNGFRANSSGLAFGVDTKISNSVLLGVGYGYMNTDADSLGHDLEVDGHNFFVYGKYQPTKWYIDAVLNYNYARYTEKKAPFAIQLRSKYDVNSYGAQVMTGYDMSYGISTEIGLRYLYIDADSYFDGVQHIRSKTDDILTAVIGAKYQKDMYKTQDLTLKPIVKLAATYDIVSDNSTANVSVLGGGNYVINSERLHRFGIEAGAGITASMGNLDLTLEYNGAFKKDYRSQSGILKARYNF